MQHFHLLVDLFLIWHIFFLSSHFLSATSLLVNERQTSESNQSQPAYSTFERRVSKRHLLGSNENTAESSVHSVHARRTLLSSSSNQSIQRSRIDNNANDDENYFNLFDLFSNQSRRTDNRGELSETDYIGYKSYRNDSTLTESVSNILDDKVDVNDEQVESANSYWALILVLFPLTTIFGNSLVVLSVFREKNLRTVTNYFVVSLALADMTVAAAVMPFAVYYEVTKRWLMSKVLCDAWVAVDVMASTASILNLVAIAVDRFISISFLVRI